MISKCPHKTDLKLYNYNDAIIMKTVKIPFFCLR